MAAHWFANAECLWLLAVVPAVGAIALLGRWRRRRRLARLASPLALAGLGGGPSPALWPAALTSTLVVALIVVGAAGPRWGRAAPPTVADGRDIVAVLDLSRSMLAQDVLPNRIARAKAALRALADCTQARGGHRLALLAFAGRPQLVCPLTTDYDTFRAKVADLDAEQLPAALRPAPGAVSGTRIGSALVRAIAALDPEHRAAEDVILVSDGDDPAGDEEWRDGLRAARRAGVPVHVIAVGDPTRESAVRLPDGALRYQGREVTTRLHEDVLEEIARRSGGAYLSPRAEPNDVASLFRERIASRPGRAAAEGAGPEVPPRPAWCFAVALALLGLTGGRTATSFLTSCARALKGLAGSLRFGRFQAQHILLPLLCVAAAFAPTPEDWIRQGTAALGTERPADALACFDQAVERTTDPGLVAFDSGVALARLGRYREAELHFRRCLGDADGPRRPRALYDLGTCLLQRSQGKQGEPVREAIGCFEQALGLLAAADPLRPDVAHNLDLAKLLLPHALAADRSAPESSPDDHPDAPGPSPREASPSVGDRDSAGAPDSPDGPIAKGAPERGKEPRRTDRSPPPGKGNLPPLPDQDALAPLSPEDTRAYLDQAAERIRQARREQLRRVAPAPSQKFPDW